MIGNCLIANKKLKFFCRENATRQKKKDQHWLSQKKKCWVSLVKISKGQKIKTVAKTMNIPYTTLYKYNEKK